MKIALLHPHGGMGDLILSFPVIAAFREAFPNAEITYVTAPGSEEVVRANPMINRVISLEPGVKAAIKLAERFRSEKIDVACALWSTARIAWLLWLAGIPVRIGQGGRLLYSFLFTHPVSVRSTIGDNESHWVECLLDYPRAFGLVPGTSEIKLKVPEKSLNNARALLRGIGISDLESIVILHCGKGENLLARGWPVDRFALIADQLSEERYHVVLTGSERETPLIEAVLKKMRTKGYSLAGKTNFMTLAAVLKLARVVICPDSGPMHLAAAVGTPVVALFLMEKDFPNRWAPWEVDHRIIRPETFPCRPECTKETCRNFLCYQVMPVKEIVRAALETTQVERFLQNQCP